MSKRFVIAVLVLMFCLGLLVADSAATFSRGAVLPQAGAGEDGLIWVGQYVWLDPGLNLRHSDLLWSPSDGR